MDSLLGTPVSWGPQPCLCARARTCLAPPTHQRIAYSLIVPVVRLVEVPRSALRRFGTIACGGKTVTAVGREAPVRCPSRLGGPTLLRTTYRSELCLRILSVSCSWVPRGTLSPRPPCLACSSSATNMRTPLPSCLQPIDAKNYAMNKGYTLLDVR